ncbi:polynucleotide 5'-hydroxyl-kinase NOL9 isoform 2-T2 [Pholidichthys leucotaenia]
MKVNKHPQVKSKSQKWRDVRGKRHRPHITPSDLNSSPVTAAVIKEHQVLVKKKPSVKRLKNKAKTVSDQKTTSSEPVCMKSHSQSNGSLAFNLDNDSDDSQEWKEYTKSVYRNGVETSGDKNNFRPGRLEGEALHYCAHRDDRKNHAVLVMQKDQTLCFRGKCMLTCLYGRVEVMGFTVEEGQQSYPVFSPASHCPLTIRAMDSVRELESKSVASRIRQKYLPQASEKKLLKHIKSNSSIILLESLETPLTRFLSSFTDLSELFSLPVSELMSAILDTPLNGLGVIPLSSTVGGLQTSNGYRVALNTVINACKGPPFTHQRSPEHMIYYGQSSCESDLDRYLEALKSLWHRRSQSRESPVIINTMGWVKGFGFQLLVDMIRFFPVSHVVQLSHGGVVQCPALTPEFLRTADGFQTHPPAQTALDEFTETHSPPRNYIHLNVQTEFQGVARQGTAKHQRSNEQRELSLLAYLSKLQSPDPGPVRHLHSLTPYQVPHTAVALGVIHCEVAPTHMFYAANASLVGLCCLSEKVTSKGGPVILSQAPICPCVGFGVLRGIDMARGLYYLLTPVDPSILCKVNCLLLGAISLPSSILKTQLGFEGETPYVTTDYSFDLTGAGKLKVFKGLMRPSQAGMQ